MTGRPAMHAACAAEFPGAHMCHVAEYLRAASGAPVPAIGAWVDPSMDIDTFYNVAGGSPAFTRYANGSNGGSCKSWTGAAASGTIVVPSGSASDGSCLVARPIACCL